MAYEAYTAMVEHIAQTAFNEWRKGGADTQPIIKRLSKEANVEEWHCNRQLTKLIIQDYQNRLLTQAE